MTNIIYILLSLIQYRYSWSVTFFLNSIVSSPFRTVAPTLLPGPGTRLNGCSSPNLTPGTHLSRYKYTHVCKLSPCSAAGRFKAQLDIIRIPTLTNCFLSGENCCFCCFPGTVCAFVQWQYKILYFFLQIGPICI